MMPITTILIVASLLLGLAFATWPPMVAYRRGVHSLRRAVGLAALNIIGMALAWAAALWLGGWFGQAAFAWAQSAGWGVFQAGLASLAGSLLVGFGAAQLALRAFRAVSGNGGSYKA